jgi:small subunit ribosomal protein S3
VGQKVNPYGFRLGITTNWKATWFFERGYKEFLIEDLRLRKAISRYCERQHISGVANVETRRKIPTEVWITIQTARPGLLIGRQGRGIEALRRELEQLIGKQIHINVEEVKDFRLDAQLTAEGIAEQIQRRAAYNRAVKRAIQETMKAGAKGIKIRCAGRLGGAEIARKEIQREGKLPLSTLRADIDYGITEAKTPYGNVGIKVWICRDDGKELPVAAMHLPPPAEEVSSSAMPAASPGPSPSSGKGKDVYSAFKVSTDESQPTGTQSPQEV